MAVLTQMMTKKTVKFRALVIQSCNLFLSSINSNEEVTNIRVYIIKKERPYAWHPMLTKVGLR